MICYNLEEHLNCINYDNGKNPLITILQLHVGQVIRRDTLINKLVLVDKGKINYSYGNFANIEIEENNLFFLPSGYDAEIVVMEHAELVIIQMGALRQLCDRCQFEQLFEIECEVNSDFPYKLPFNERVTDYLNALKIYYSEGLRCYYFHELKLKELFYIFRLYYPKEDMKRLFHPLLTNNISFSDTVLQASANARSVKDLAEATDYSVSGFSKRFRKVFNEPAYQWLQQKRADRLFKEINRTNLSLKVLIDNEGFSSSSELNKFCRRYYGDTPANLRKLSKKG